ncbi:hypothetical protein D3C78_1237510 [compost metagenome]
MVAEAHRLGGLQVGEAGHDDVGVLLGLGQQALLQAGDFAEDHVDLVAQPQADVGGHLVVAATPGVQLLAGDADAVGQTRLDVHVHVFQIDAPVELAGLDLGLDLLQAGDDGVALGGAQHAGLLQHGGVGDGTHDVVAVQALVEVDGSGEAGDEGIDRFAEPAAPGLVGFFAAHQVSRAVFMQRTEARGPYAGMIPARPEKPGSGVR